MKKTNWNLIYRAINVASLNVKKKKTVRWHYYFSMRCSRNAISTPTFHFSLVICRINTITFLSAIGSSCTLVYFNMHWNAYSLHHSETTSLKYSSAFQAWRMDLGTQDMTLRDRWRCTINKAVHFNANRGYMHAFA